MSARLFRDVEVEGVRTDVRTRGGVIAEIGSGLVPGDEEVVDGRGGALIPGLHDHHLHLLALAADRSSVDCSAGFAGLAEAPDDGWVRGVRSPVSVDRHALDAIEPRRPVRVQHRSGALWMLNSPALAAVGHVLEDSGDVERDHDGIPTGRLWRYDERLRPALPETEPGPGLAIVVDELRRLGITSVTDATPDLDPSAVQLLDSLPLPVTMLGDPDGTAPRKLLLRDHDLPRYDELSEVIGRTHAAGRPVAVHCVTRESLLLTIAVLDDVGRLPGDRIEHAAVVPDPSALRGLKVVTQPGFLADRGDDYLRDVHHDDRPHLYRYASLCSEGVEVLPSSDAPYGPVDPWAVMRAARDRRSAAGATIGAGERVSPARVLDGYLCDSEGRRRTVTVGSPAHLTLLSGSLVEVLSAPSREAVVMTSATDLLEHGVHHLRDGE